MSVSRFARPALEPVTQPVSDARTHDLLAQVESAIVALGATKLELPTPEFKFEAPALDSDPRLDGLAAALGELHALLLEMATRPAPAPAPVTVELPGELVATLRALADRPDGTVKLDDATIAALAKAMPEPPKVVGGSQTRRVQLLDGAAIVSPATADKQDVQTTHLAAIETAVEGAQADALTDTELRATPVPVSGTVTASGALTETTFTGRVPDEVGTWGYYSGTNGTENVGAGERVLQISAIAPGGSNATMTIDAGDTITVPSGKAITITPRGNLTAPTVVFTGTAAYFIETVS